MLFHTTQERSEREHIPSRQNEGGKAKNVIHAKEMSKFSKLVSCRPDFFKKYFTLAPL